MSDALLEPPLEGELEPARAALAELVPALADFQRASACTLFLGTLRGRDPAARWRRVMLAAGLGARFRQELAATLKGEVAGKELVPFDFAAPLRDQILVLRRDELPSVAAWLDAVPTADWPHLFSGEPELVRHVRLQVARIAVQGSERQAVLVRQKTPGTLTRTGGLLALLGERQHEFREVEGRVVELALRTDFLAWRDWVFVSNAPVFEVLTGVRELTLRKAQEALGRVAATPGVRIPRLEEASAALAGSLRLTKRLAASERQGIARELRPERLREIVRRRGLALEVREEGEGTVIDLDPTRPEQLRDFVDLMTDSLLDGAVTDLAYRVGQKSPDRRARRDG